MSKQSERYVIQRLKKAEKRVKALEKLVDVLEEELNASQDNRLELLNRHFNSPIARTMRREYIYSCIMDDGAGEQDKLFASVKDDSDFPGALKKWAYGVIYGWRHPDTMTAAQFKFEFEKEFRNELTEIFAERMRRFEEQDGE
jgi:hypothetical protein